MTRVCINDFNTLPQPSYCEDESKLHKHGNHCEIHSFPWLQFKNEEYIKSECLNEMLSAHNIYFNYCI